VLTGFETVHFVQWWNHWQLIVCNRMDWKMFKLIEDNQLHFVTLAI